MTKLDGVDAGDLRDALADARTVKATKRLMVALAYKDGVDVERIVARYGIPQSTIYYWLDRFEGQPVEAAATDDTSPGRPPRLSPEQQSTVRDWLQQPPRDVGVRADEWTPELLRDHLRSAFGVDYSLGHVRRLFYGRDN
jgi:transposase